MKIKIKNGKALNASNDSLLIKEFVEAVAIANGDAIPEVFYKRHEGKVLELDNYNKIISVTVIIESPLKIMLDETEQTRLEALRILNKEFRHGDQVRYIPNHVKSKDTLNPQCQTGIVVGISKIKMNTR